MNEAICGIATAIEVEPRGAREEASKTPASRRNVRFSGNGGYPRKGLVRIVKRF
jgi:hypothetical protein